MSKYLIYIKLIYTKYKNKMYGPGGGKRGNKGDMRDCKRNAKQRFKNN